MISICRRHVKKLKDSYLSERVARYLSLLPEVNLAFSIDINHHYYYHNSFTSLSLTRIFHYHWGGIEKQKFSGSPWAISRHILPRRRVSDFFVATLVIALSFYMIMILKKVSWCNLFNLSKPSHQEDIGKWVFNVDFWSKDKRVFCVRYRFGFATFMLTSPFLWQQKWKHWTFIFLFLPPCFSRKLGKI